MNYSNDSKCDTRTTMDPQDNPTMFNGQRNNISKDRGGGGGGWYALPYDIVIIVRNLLTTLVTNVVIHY